MGFAEANKVCAMKARLGTFTLVSAATDTPFLSEEKKMLKTPESAEAVADFKHSRSDC